MEEGKICYVQGDTDFEVLREFSGSCTFRELAEKYLSERYAQAVYEGGYKEREGGGN